MLNDTLSCKLAKLAKAIISGKTTIPETVVSEETLSVNEKLDPNDGAEVWIRDFINSKDSHLADASKGKRIKMALAAREAARKDAGIAEAEGQDLQEKVEHGYESMEISTYTTSGDTSSDHTVYEISFDGEVIGNLDVDTTNGFIGGNLYGKDLPELSDYAAPAHITALLSFFNSKKGSEWLKAPVIASTPDAVLDPASGKNVEDQALVVEYSDPATDGSMTTVNNLSTTPASENGVDYNPPPTIFHYDQGKETEKPIQINGEVKATSKFVITFKDQGGKEYSKTVSAISLENGIEQLKQLNVISQDDVMVGFTTEPFKE